MGAATMDIDLGLSADELALRERARAFAVEVVRPRAAAIDRDEQYPWDIVKALCLGADAVLVGRAYGYGLAAAGEAGVARALAILKADLLRTMTLLGAQSIAALGPEFVRLREDFRVD